MPSKRTTASQMALGGIMGALAVVLMSLGTLIPVATYACPILCVMLGKIVLTSCGKRITWAWYGAVALLCLLLTPDKEAAAVFVFLGYYPIVKPALDRKKLPCLWKGLLFNSSVLTMYWLLMHLLGMKHLVEEFEGLDFAMTAVLLVLGNATFFLLDRLLGMRLNRKR